MKIIRTNIRPNETGSWVEMMLGENEQPLEMEEYLHFSVHVEHHPEGRLLLPELQKVALKRLAAEVSEQIQRIDRALSQ